MSNQNPKIATLTSWGNIKSITSRIYRVLLDQVPQDDSYIPYGNGRSYGDSALNKHIIKTTAHHQILSFDAQEGVIHCQAGIVLGTILEEIVPKGWFLPVTPGTKMITLGGAVAADVHGKNHHGSGCFSEHINFIKLQLPSAEIVECSPTKNAALFRATCGGVGLTGVITEVCFNLKLIQGGYINQEVIKTKTLQETFKKLEQHSKKTYIVAWLDLLHHHHEFCKGIVFLGTHAQKKGGDFSSKQTISIPKYFPSVLLNPISMNVYHWKYYRKFKEEASLVPLDTFFYPLDALKNWNNLYGKKGMVQYQFVVPKKSAYEAIFKIIANVTASTYPSYLSVLKPLGVANQNLLSFPMEGYTLSMDFKMKRGLYAFLETLDPIVNQYGGRIYLVKDARIPKAAFEKGYPKLNEFRKFRKDNGLLQLQSLQSKRLGL